MANNNQRQLPSAGVNPFRPQHSCNSKRFPHMPAFSGKQAITIFQPQTSTKNPVNRIQRKRGWIWLAWDGSMPCCVATVFVAGKPLLLWPCFPQHKRRARLYICTQEAGSGCSFPGPEVFKDKCLSFSLCVLTLYYCWNTHVTSAIHKSGASLTALMWLSHPGVMIEIARTETILEAESGSRTMKCLGGH